MFLTDLLLKGGAWMLIFRLLFSLLVLAGTIGGIAQTTQANEPVTKAVVTRPTR